MSGPKKIFYDDSTRIYEILDKKPIPVEQLLRSEKEKRPELSELINEMADYHHQKLFCQLMQAMTAYFQKATFNGEDSVNFLYSFVFTLEKKLSLQGVANLVSLTVDLLETSDALLFIEKFETLVDPSTNVYICLQLCKVNILIQAHQMEEASDILFGELSTMIEKKIAVDLYTNSCFYKTCSNYFRASDNPKELYNCLLLYLAYTPLDQVKRQSEMAFELCVTGFVAPGMFDFGELRTHPILATLHNDTEKQWILEILDAALEGSLTLYKAAKEKYHDLIQLAFKDKINQLDEKMTLAALIELAFQQPKENRKIPLQRIAEYCHISMQQCERLVMKTMSLELIKGSIDEVNSTLYITWVKPRLVDADRVGILKSRFVAWSENISELITHLDDATKHILAT